MKVLQVWFKPLGMMAGVMEASTAEDCGGALQQAEVGNEH